MKKYKVTFLPGFEEGLNNAVDYLSIKLRNPDAAEALVDRVEKAIKERSREPEAFEKYRSSKERLGQTGYSGSSRATVVEGP